MRSVGQDDCEWESVRRVGYEAGLAQGGRHLCQTGFSSPSPQALLIHADEPGNQLAKNRNTRSSYTRSGTSRPATDSTK